MNQGFTPRVETRQHTVAELEKMTDHELLYFAFYWDNRKAYTADAFAAQTVSHNNDGATSEIAARWGESAGDRLADYFANTHASYSDRLDMADWHTQLLIDIARGAHTHGHGRRDQPFCHCGHRYI